MALACPHCKKPMHAGQREHVLFWSCADCKRVFADFFCLGCRGFLQYKQGKGRSYYWQCTNTSCNTIFAYGARCASCSGALQWKPGNDGVGRWYCTSCGIGIGPSDKEAAGNHHHRQELQGEAPGRRVSAEPQRAAEAHQEADQTAVHRHGPPSQADAHQPRADVNDIAFQSVQMPKERPAPSGQETASPASGAGRLEEIRKLLKSHATHTIDPDELRDHVLELAAQLDALSRKPRGLAAGESSARWPAPEPETARQLAEAIDTIRGDFARRSEGLRQALEDMGTRLAALDAAIGQAADLRPYVEERFRALAAQEPDLSAATIEAIGAAVQKRFARWVEALEGSFQAHGLKLIKDLPKLFDSIHHELTGYESGHGLRERELAAREEVVKSLTKVWKRITYWQRQHQIETIPVDGAGGQPFQESRHQPSKQEPTDDPARRNTIKTIHNYGYMWRGKLLRKAEVEVWVPAPPGPGPAPAAVAAADADPPTTEAPPGEAPSAHE